MIKIIVYSEWKADNPTPSVLDHVVLVGVVLAKNVTDYDQLSHFRVSFK